MPEGLSGGKGKSLSGSSAALRPDTSTDFSSGCFCLWCWSGGVPSDAKWVRTAHCLCFTHPSQSERNYAQIEKEALSLVFGIKKFHRYLYGRHFILMTDHKPLTSILGPKQGIPPLAAARMQRWALLLSAYSYEIKFRSTKMHANADGLSRLPLPEDLPVGNAPDPAIYNMAQLESLPIKAQEVAAATVADPVLHKVLIALRTGWPAVGGRRPSALRVAASYGGAG